MKSNAQLPSSAALIPQDVMLREGREFGESLLGELNHIRTSHVRLIQAFLGQTTGYYVYRMSVSLLHLCLNRVCSSLIDISVIPWTDNPIRYSLHRRGCDTLDIHALCVVASRIVIEWFWFSIMFTSNRNRNSSGFSLRLLLIEIHALS